MTMSEQIQNQSWDELLSDEALDSEMDEGLTTHQDRRFLFLWLPFAVIGVCLVAFSGVIINGIDLVGIGLVLLCALATMYDSHKVDRGDWKA